MIKNANLSNKEKRECRVKAAQYSVVMHLNIENFNKFFGIKDIDRMLNENYRFDKLNVKQ